MPDPTTSRSARGIVALNTAKLRVAELEHQMEMALGEVKRLEEVELPAAFTEDGVSELIILGGVGAKRSVDIVGNLPSEVEHPVEREHALTWLAENGYQDIIRCVVAADFGQENREAALAVYDTLRGNNLAAVTKKETVHHSTLRALIRQRMSANPPLDTPLEELGCAIVRRVKLTTPPRVRTTPAQRPQGTTPTTAHEPEDQ